MDLQYDRAAGRFTDRFASFLGAWLRQARAEQVARGYSDDFPIEAYQAYMEPVVRHPARQCLDCGVLTHDGPGHYSRCPAHTLSLFDRLTHSNQVVRLAAIRELRPKPRWCTERSSRRGLSAPFYTGKEKSDGPHS
jgi:hypothetical protein